MIYLYIVTLLFYLVVSIPVWIYVKSKKVKKGGEIEMNCCGKFMKMVIYFKEDFEWNKFIKVVNTTYLRVMIFTFL